MANRVVFWEESARIEKLFKQKHTLHCLELVRVTGAHADVPDESRFHNVVKCLHRFFNGCVMIKAMACMRIVVRSR